jgi:hypothetical protein
MKNEEMDSESSDEEKIPVSNRANKRRRPDDIENAIKKEPI